MPKNPAIVPAKEQNLNNPLTNVVLLNVIKPNKQYANPRTNLTPAIVKQNNMAVNSESSNKWLRVKPIPERNPRRKNHLTVARDFGNSSMTGASV